MYQSFHSTNSRRRMQYVFMGSMLIGLGVVTYGIVSLVHTGHDIEKCMNMVVTNTHAICEIMKQFGPANVTCANLQMR